MKTQRKVVIIIIQIYNNRSLINNNNSSLFLLQFCHYFLCIVGMDRQIKVDVMKTLKE